MNDEMNKQNNNSTVVSNSDEKARKIKGLIVLVTVLVIALLGLGSYVVYDKIISKESDTNKETVVDDTKDDSDIKDKVKNIDVNSIVVKGLLDMLQLPVTDGCPQYYFSRAKYNASDISLYDKTILAFMYISSNKINNPTFEEFSFSSIDNQINKMFGNTNISERFTIDGCSIGQNVNFKPDLANSKYVRKYWFEDGYEGGCGGTCASQLFGSKVSKATITNDTTIEIYEKYMLTDLGEYITGAGNMEKKLNKDECASLSNAQCFDHFYNQLYSVKYTFELNDDNTTYHFVSSEIITE